jgi:6-phosphogluconolactonase
MAIIYHKFRKEYTILNQFYFFTGGYTEPIQMASGETLPGKCKGITCYAFVEETGDLKRLAVTASTPNPSFVLADPEAPYLYCVNELKEYEGIYGSTVSAYEICGETGELKLLNRQFTCGADACHLAFSPDRRYLIATNYSGGSFCVFPILADHSLGHASCILRHQGKGVNQERQEGPHPHQTILSPDGEVVYVSDLGLDCLAGYWTDWEKGWLIPEERLDIKGVPGQGIRHGVFNTDGTNLYVMTEMACEVNVYEYKKDSGETELVQTLSAMPENCEIPSLGAAIRLHPNGKWLYVSVRGSNHLAVFSIKEDGKLEMIETQSSGGEIPRDFILSPNGKYLLAGHQDSDTICIFKIDQESGRLRLIHTEEGAYCVTVLAAWRSQQK